MKKPVGRIAMRVEGDKWTAYWAKPDTMEGALWLCSISMGFVPDHDRRQRLIDLIKDGMTEFLESHFDKKVESWQTESAPESERSGNA